MQRPKRTNIIKTSTVVKPVTTTPNSPTLSTITTTSTNIAPPASDNNNNINFLILNLNNTNHNNNDTMLDINKRKHEYSSVPIMDLNIHNDCDDDKKIQKRRNCRSIIIQQIRYLILLITNSVQQLSLFQKRIIIVICCYICFHFVIVLYDSRYRTYEIPFLLLNVRDSVGTESTINNNNKTFSIVVNTYKRPERLYNSIIHYGHTCGRSIGIDTIYIVWAEEDTQPPTKISFYDRYDTTYNTIRQHNTNSSSSSSSSNNSSNRATIQIIRVKNSLNNRFLPLPRNSTTSTDSEAIFMVDDDIRVDCLSLQYAYLAWTISPMSMVGFYPRLISSRKTTSTTSTKTTNSAIARTTTGGQYDYHTWPTVYMYNRMNILLTKACFLHERYLYEYTSTNHPIDIKNYINQYKNCEDIAMSILVTNITQYEKQQYIMKTQLQQQQQQNEELAIIEGRPIYVEGTIIDDGTFGGISTGTGHMKRRSQCVDDIIAIYKKYNWTISLFGSTTTPSTTTSYSLHESSYVQHQPKLLQLYLTRPSNFLEWFGIPTIFLW